MAIYKHGVYVGEQETNLVIPNESTAGLQVIFGTAPINLADTSNVNNPVICYSFSDAVKALGYSDDWEKFTLCQSMDACFRLYSIAPVIFVNVLDPKTHTKVLNATAPIVGGKATLEQEGVLTDGLTVKVASSELTLGEDYELSFDSNGYLVATFLKSQTGTATFEGNELDTSKVTANDIIGSLDASTGVETGLELVRKIYPMYGLNAGLLLAPGWSHNPTVAAALQAKCTAINGCYSCECLIDIPTDGEDGAKVYADVKAAKESLGVNDKHAYALWPMIKVGDKKYYYSAVMGALIAQCDADNGDVPAVSPSNKSLNVTATVLADGTEIYLDQEQANLVNSYGVTTALNLNGIKSWGNNTAAFPSTTDPKDKWFAVRRFFSWWGNNFIRRYFQKVDDPTNYRLIESIVDSENIIGNGYVARGYCAEAKCSFLADENPVTDILSGKIKFHLYLAPYTPAESIEAILEFNPSAITESIFGGEQ